MRVVAICNQKGGVGKTALTTALATIYSISSRVLVIDADPQANATSILGVHVGVDDLTLANLLTRLSPVDHRVATSLAIRPAGDPWRGVDVIPSERRLAAREADTSLGRESFLRSAIETMTNDHDVVLIDCPPSLGMLTVNALVAATDALVVTEPRTSSVSAVAEMLQTIAAVRAHYNPGLSLVGIAVNRWSSHRLDSRAHCDVLSAEYPQWLLQPPVPEREIVAVAATNGVPIPAEGPGFEVLSAVKAMAVAGGLL